MTKANRLEQNLYKSKAISLLEMLLVIVLAAIMAIAAIRYFSVIKEKEKINTLILQYNAIYKAVHQCIGSKKAGLVTDSHVKSMDCFSEDFIALIDAGYLNNTINFNPWGGSPSFKNALYAMNNGARMKIISYGVPHKSCEKIKRAAVTALPPGATINVSSNTGCIFSAPVQ